VLHGADGAPLVMAGDVETAVEIAAKHGLAFVTVPWTVVCASTVRHGLNQGDYDQITRLADARRDLIDAWHRAAVALA
jgi:hypothetical protein